MKQTPFNETLRKWRGPMTQEQAAKVIGVPLGTYRNWEQGVREPRGLAKVAVKKCSRPVKGNA